MSKHYGSLVGIAALVGAVLLVLERAPPERTPQDSQATPPVTAAPTREVEEVEAHRPTAVPLPSRNTVQVGDETIELHVHIAARSRHDLRDVDDGTSAGFFERLAPLAALGDETAIGLLYRALDRCERLGAPRSADELAAKERFVHDTWAKMGGRAPDGSELSLDATLAMWRTAHERCRDVTPSMLAQSIEYLRQSAERGRDLDNQLAFARAIRETEPDTARAVLQTLWAERGYVLALNELARDSLAHQLAWLAASGDPQHQLAGIERSVPPYAYREAQREAAEILKNPNCCTQ